MFPVLLRHGHIITSNIKAEYISPYSPPISLGSSMMALLVSSGDEIPSSPEYDNSGDIAPGTEKQLTFVWIDKNPGKTPKGRQWDLLNREGRVKDVNIARNHTPRDVKDIIRKNFPQLALADFTRKLYRLLGFIPINRPEYPACLHLVENE